MVNLAFTWHKIGKTLRLLSSHFSCTDTEKFAVTGDAISCIISSSYTKFAMYCVPPIAAKPLILELSVSSTHLPTAAQQSDCSQYDHRNSAKPKT